MNRSSTRFAPAMPPWECELCCVTMRSWPSTWPTVTDKLWLSRYILARPLCRRSCPRVTAIDALTAARYADVIRLRAVRMIAPHGFGYLGQALSSAELFATLYSRHYDPGRDSLVVSPGHYIIAAFAAAPEAAVTPENPTLIGGGRAAPAGAMGAAPPWPP